MAPRGVHRGCVEREGGPRRRGNLPGSSRRCFLVVLVSRFFLYRVGRRRQAGAVDVDFPCRYDRQVRGILCWNQARQGRALRVSCGLRG